MLARVPPVAPRTGWSGALSLASDLSGDTSSPWREAAGLIRGGLVERLRLRWRGLVRAPWRPALRRLALPLAAIHLAVWATGIAGVFDPLPLGKWWTLVLGGSVLALIGAALRWRAVAAVGALGVFAALAAQGSANYLSPTGGLTHFSSGIGSTALDLDAAMFPAALVLVAASVALPARPELSTAALVRLLSAALPAVGLWLVARPGEPGLPEPGIPEPGGLLVAALLALAAVAVAWCAYRRRRDPAAGVLGAAILAAAAPEAVWLLPSPWGFWDDASLALLATGGMIAAAACFALVGSSHASAD